MPILTVRLVKCRRSARDPDRHGAVAFADDAVERHRQRAHWVADLDHEVGKHAGPQFVARIFDDGTDQNPAGVGVDGEADRVDAAFEHVVRIGWDLDLQRLPDPIGRRVAFRHVGEEPHGRDIGDRVGRGRVAGLDVEPRCRVARRDAARDRAVDDQDRIDFALLDHPIHLGVGLAEDAYRVARSAQVALRGLLVGDRLLELLL